jgi:hypothetical protein
MYRNSVAFNLSTSWHMSHFVCDDVAYGGQEAAVRSMQPVAPSCAVNHVSFRNPCGFQTTKTLRKHRSMLLRSCVWRAHHAPPFVCHRSLMVMLCRMRALHRLLNMIRPWCWRWWLPMRCEQSLSYIFVIMACPSAAQRAAVYLAHVALFLIWIESEIIMAYCLYIMQMSVRCR